MKFTRYSLMYLATYLTAGGLGYLFVPNEFSKLLLSNDTYQEMPLRLAGLFCLLLGIVVIQIVRLRVEVLYSSTIFVRSIALVALITFYFMTYNPMFITLFVIVLVGFIATIASLMHSAKENARLKL